MSCIDRGLLTSSCDTHTKQKQQNKQTTNKKHAREVATLQTLSHGKHV